jgi:hypothetical protein
LLGKPTPQVFVPAGAQVLSGAQVVLRQSALAVHGSPSHFLHVPPQSVPVSAPSCTPFVHEAGWQVPLAQLPLAQSAGAAQAAPSAHLGPAAPHFGAASALASGGGGGAVVVPVVVVEGVGVGVSPGSGTLLHAGNTHASATRQSGTARRPMEICRIGPR